MRLSVVIPTYNRRESVARCLESLADQDLPVDRYEVIAVDDASTDGTIETLNQLRLRIELVVLGQPRNLGQAAARNRGAARARGQILLFLDDDMLSSRDLLSTHLAAQAAHTHPTLVFGKTLEDLRGTSSIAKEEYDASFLQSYRDLAVAEPQWPANAWAGPNCSLPKRTFIESGGYDEQGFSRRGEDWDLGVRLWKRGVQFAFEPRARATHRLVKSNVQLLRDDEEDGASIVALCRKHPDLRPSIGYSAIVSASAWKKWLARVLAVAPWLMTPLLTILLATLERVPRRTWVFRARKRAFELRRMISELSGARRRAGSWAALTHVFGPRLPVLLYHHIGCPTAHTRRLRLTTSPARFERHLRLIRRLGYNPITPLQWLAWIDNGTALPSKPVMLTIDDAYADTSRYALPLLRKYGFVATVFVITGHSRQGRSWERLPVMTMDEIQDWAGLGFEFGAHSHSHPDLTAASARDLSSEVEQARNDLIQIGLEPSSFSYPFGSFDDRVRAAVAERFRMAFTCAEGSNDLFTDLHRMRRIEIRPLDTVVDIAFYLRFGWSPLRTAANFCRPRARWHGLVSGIRRYLVIGPSARSTGDT